MEIQEEFEKQETGYFAGELFTSGINSAFPFSNGTISLSK